MKFYCFKCRGPPKAPFAPVLAPLRSSGTAAIPGISRADHGAFTVRKSQPLPSRKPRADSWSRFSWRNASWPDYEKHNTAHSIIANAGVISATLLRVGPPGYFTHISITTPFEKLLYLELSISRSPNGFFFSTSGSRWLFQKRNGRYETVSEVKRLYKFITAISATVIQGGPPRYFTHFSITTPIASALKNYYV